MTEPCLAEEDYLTITTYYPSPHGSYNELQTNKITVGDTDGNGSLDIEDQPPEDGQLYVARGVIYRPQSSLPAGVKQGELVYISNATEKNFYYYNGSSWIKQADEGSGLKIVKDIKFSASSEVDCGIGWQIIQCGAATDFGGNPVGKAIEEMQGASGCSWNCYGSQKCRIYSGRYSAIIAICAKE